jgi:hypothetical protein
LYLDSEVAPKPPTILYRRPLGTSGETTVQQKKLNR